MFLIKMEDMLYLHNFIRGTIPQGFLTLYLDPRLKHLRSTEILHLDISDVSELAVVYELISEFST